MKLIFLTLSICFASDTPKLEFMKIQFSEKTTTVQVLGRIMPNLGALQVERANMAGKISAVLIKEGDHIKPGMPLLRVSGPDCASNCVVSAGRDGVVSEILKKQGQKIAPGDGIVNVLNPVGISVRLDVPAKYAGYISSGQVINLKLSQKPFTKFNARVSEVLPILGDGDTTRGFRLTPIGSSPGIGLDSLVNAEIPIPLNGSGSRVPATAVGFYGSRHFIIKKKGEALEPIPVQVISESSDSLWIRPLPGVTIVDGDSILSSRTIFLLPKLLSEKGY